MYFYMCICLHVYIIIHKWSQTAGSISALFNRLVLFDYLTWHMTPCRAMLATNSIYQACFSIAHLRRWAHSEHRMSGVELRWKDKTTRWRHTAAIPKEVPAGQPRAEHVYLSKQSQRQRFKQALKQVTATGQHINSINLSQQNMQLPVFRRNELSVQWAVSDVSHGIGRYQDS